MTTVPEFIRFQSAVPNGRGDFPGVFAMVNGLGHSGVLDSVEKAWWRQSNAEANTKYPDPSTVEATCYDRELNPRARSWFPCSAVDLLVLTRGYLGLLDRHQVRWVELRTSSPGRIVYADHVQVVAVPYRHPVDWPLPDPPG